MAKTDELATKILEEFRIQANIPYHSKHMRYANAKDVLVAMIEEHEKQRTRLTDREMQIFQVAVKYAMLYANVTQRSYSYEDCIRGVADWLGFEIHEEDIRILCGPTMMGDKQNP